MLMVAFARELMSRYKSDEVRTRTAIPVAAAVLLLSACGPSREELIAAWSRECAAVDLQPGTAEFSDCVLEKERLHIARARDRLLSYGAYQISRGADPAVYGSVRHRFAGQRPAGGDHDRD
jgi:hypothetical protein